MQLAVSIYGSCVSRDVVRTQESAFRLVHYAARSSWISATGRPVPKPTVASLLESAFQQRMLEEDYSSTALTKTLTSESDLIMLDLIDERLGVYPATSGGFVTWLTELGRSGWVPHTPHGPLIEFGTEEHLALFEQAAGAVSASLAGRNAVLLEVRFASNTVEGSLTPLIRNRHPSEWDELYQPYYLAARAAGIPVLTVPEELAVSTEKHRWGVSPFHYTDAFYEWIATQLLQSRFRGN